MMDGLQISIPQRMALVRAILIFSLICCMLSSFPLWGGERDFPVAALIDHVNLRAPYDFLWPFLYLLAALSALVSVKPRIFAFIAVLIGAWMCVNDISRLQTWFYVFNAMLLVYVFYDGRVDDSSKYTSYFIILQIIVASVYFFTGLYQLNEHFVQDIFRPLMSPLQSFLSHRQFELFVSAGKIAPFILMFIGAGLIISPVRYLAIAFALIMHVSLLLLMVPSEKQPLYATWMSNAAFALLLVFLFSGKTKQRYYSPTFLFQMPVFYMVIILFCVLPFFNLRGYWPDSLSFNSMSGQSKKVEIKITKRLFEKLPLYQRHFYSGYEDEYLLDYEQWCREELHADIVTVTPVFNSIYGYLARFDKSGVKERELSGLYSGPLLALRRGNSIFAPE